VVKVVLRGLRDKPGVGAEVFSALTRAGIHLLQVSYDSATKGRSDIGLAILESQMKTCAETCSEILEDSGGELWSVYEDVAMLSFEIAPDASVSAVLAEIFNLMASYGVNVDMISYARGILSILVKVYGLEDALGALSDLGISPEIGA